MAQSDPKKLLEKNRQLIHSEQQKVVSHTQRDEKDSDWVIHTVMIEGCEAPFRFRRQQQYQNLKGARINLTYYRSVEQLAGMDFEVMNVVRIKRA